MPDGSVINWDESLYLRIQVKKACLAQQAFATIDVGGIPQSVRQGLLSQFSAYRKRQRDTEGLDDDEYVNVVISVGYDIGGTQTVSPIFHGQVALVEPLSGPPNALIRATCYTNQVDRTKYTTGIAPATSTLRAFCIWAAQQMGLSADIQTSYDDMVIENPGRKVFVVNQLLLEIQRFDRQNIIAYIDDNTLIVRDTNKLLSPSEVYDIYRIIEQPSWSEWGVNFSMLFDNRVRLATGVHLHSVTNPSVNDSDLIVMQIEYVMASRSNEFTMKIETAPAA